jgi:hypothetical protein
VVSQWQPGYGRGTKASVSLPAYNAAQLIGAANYLKASQLPNAGSTDTPEDLTALLSPSFSGESAVYSHVINLLSSLQSAPSCNRLATSSLLNACQSIDGPPSGVQSALNDVRSRYAAQLAVCELRDAGSDTPPFCDMIPSSGTGKAGAVNSDTFPRSQLEACLKSLESRPQWWTSYSNSKQNAVMLCQAARAEIEKGLFLLYYWTAQTDAQIDELIELYKSMAHTSSDVETALLQTMKVAGDDLSRRREFATAVEDFQKRLSRDLEQSNIEAQSYFSKFVQSLHHSVETIFERISAAAREVELDITAFSQVRSP